MSLLSRVLFQSREIKKCNGIKVDQKVDLYYRDNGEMQLGIEQIK